MKVSGLRRVGAVVAGLVVGVITITAVEAAGHSLFPVAPAMDPNHPELMADYIKSLPLSALLFIIFAWAMGSLIGGSISTFVSRDQKSVTALICGALLMLLGVVNLLTFPHPIWFWVLGIGVYLPFAWVGFRISRKRPEFDAVNNVK